MDGHHGNSSSGREPGRNVCLETAWSNKNGLDSLKGIHQKRREVAFFLPEVLGGIDLVDVGIIFLLSRNKDFNHPDPPRTILDFSRNRLLLRYLWTDFHEENIGMKPIKKISLSLILTTTLLLTQQSSFAGGGTHWGYTGHEGPQDWGALDPDYHICQSGREQSPININRSTQSSSKPIHFWYSSEPDNIVNNGHTIQVNMEEGSRIKLNGKIYELLQFHFHSPSEHQINGKHAAMVIHFVHQAEDGQLGVIGLLLDKGPSNQIITQLWQHIPKHHGDEVPLPSMIDIKRLLPVNRAYYNYRGSLTTPPCSEGVNWVVLKGRASVSQQQISKFTRIFRKSVRPVQPIHHRTVYAK